MGKSSAKLTSPTKSIPSSNARHQPATTGPTVAPVKLTLKQPQPPGEVSGSGTEGIYSVTAVEPLKLSIKRASILPHTQETSKRSKMKRRSKNSSSSTSGASNPLSNPVISGNQNIWVNPSSNPISVFHLCTHIILRSLSRDLDVSLRPPPFALTN